MELNEYPDINPYTHEHLIFFFIKKPKIYNGKKKASLTDGVGFI